MYLYTCCNSPVKVQNICETTNFFMNYFLSRTGVIYFFFGLICERNEIEATFGTSKRVYRANDIRAKLDNTANTWIGACSFAKNVMKFLRGLLCLVFTKTGLETLKKRVLSTIDDLVGVLPSPQVSWGKIN